jgi:hypothetical protein
MQAVDVMTATAIEFALYTASLSFAQIALATWKKYEPPK